MLFPRGDNFGGVVSLMLLGELLLTVDLLNTTERSPSPPTSFRKYGQLQKTRITFHLESLNLLNITFISISIKKSKRNISKLLYFVYKNVDS